MLDQINMEAAKKYWPWILGGMVGIYLVSKYYSGQSGSVAYSSTAVVDPVAAAQAQAINTAAQTAAQTAASDSANQRLTILSDAAKSIGDTENQQLAISMAGQSAYTESQAHMVNAVINGAVQLAAAQSLIPIAAINAASVSNQATLMAGANVASSGNNAIADIIRSESAAVAAQNIATAQSASASSQMVSNIEVANIQATQKSNGYNVSGGVSGNGYNVSGGLSGNGYNVSGGMYGGY